MAKDLVDSYFQLGNADNTDSYQPGSDKQLVDLTEFYSETDQDDATTMVQGIEEFNLGKLSRKTAMKLGLKNAHALDPIATERNAVVGAEGFFSTVVEGFKKFIETIIRYIRMAIDWVVNLIKRIFGFKKSERIEKAINDDLDNVKKAFTKIMAGLGFPESEYNLEAFIGRLPKGQDPFNQLVLMKNRLASEEDSIRNLADSIPVIKEVSQVAVRSGRKATLAATNFKKTLEEQFKRSYVRAATNQVVPAQNSPEVMKLLASMQEVQLSLDSEELIVKVVELYKKLYNIDFTNDELKNGFNKVRETLRKQIDTKSSKISAVNSVEVLGSIQYLNTRYYDLMDDEMDIKSVDWKALGDLINKPEAEKIQKLAAMYGDPQLVTSYQNMSVGVRNYMQFCFAITDEMNKLLTQSTNLIRWYYRTNAFFFHGCANEVDEIIKINKQARAEGLNPYAKENGLPKVTFFLKAADAQNFAENFAATSHEIITKDFGGCKTVINNFSQQIGLGKTL